MPSVNLVINFDVPTHSKDYIHRGGRTARAGRAGKAILFVTQYDAEFLQRLEDVLGQKLELWPTDKKVMLLLRERVDEAAANELKKQGKAKRKRRLSDRDGDDRDRDASRGAEKGGCEPYLYVMHP